MALLFLSLVLLLFVFVLGMLCGHRKLFPFGMVFLAKRRMAARWSRTTEDEFVAQQDFGLDIIDVAQLHERRRALLQWLWGRAELPKLKPVVPIELSACTLSASVAAIASIEHWKLEMDFGLDSNMTLFTPHALSQDISLIYQQGHEGDVEHGRHTILYFVKRGFRVLALAMPLKGRNSQPFIRLKKHGIVKLSDHDYFRLVDHDRGTNCVRFFCEPVLAAVNHLRDRGAKGIAMLGSSGGGWITAFYAAIDTRVLQSFPVAGSLPFSLCGPGELSDYEVHHPELFGIANHLELYAMAACSPYRLSMQIFNRFDPVIWAGTRSLRYEAVVQNALKRIHGGSFRVMIDDSWVGHGISKQALASILDALDNSRAAEPTRPSYVG